MLFHVYICIGDHKNVFDKLVTFFVEVAAVKVTEVVAWQLSSQNVTIIFHSIINPS